ncbi:MAG: family 10 glycosylhydrolase [Bacilli bacterium]|nr:family 10 glycosylhydrolase [Bacilli bacterium]
MKLCKKILFSLLICCLMITSLSVFAEEDEEVIELDYTYYGTTTKVTIPKNYIEPEAEMRGAWVATVYNLDFPKQVGTSSDAIKAYKENFLNVLDTLEEYNMNTIFFQVRPCNDAFYKSEINPWSQFLVGAGVDPGWDPLEWMVEETHKRGMEFQCWMNAFRTTAGSILPNGAIARQYSTSELLAYKKSAIKTMGDNSYAKLHPESVLMGSEDCMLILNPGDLGVQKHLVDTLQEIIENYDVDGLHFDDYFYLNASAHSETVNRNFAGGEEYDKSLTGENTLNDLPTYEDYKANPEKYNMEEGLSLGDFRRESINNLMRSIRKMIDEHNAKYGKHVEYGSKPAAVWQSSAESCPDGAENASTEGSNNTCHAYQSNWNLYADTKKWVEEGLVDWVAPQVYYDFENREVPYADIVTWWANVVTKTNEKRKAEGLKPLKMYVAHGIYLFDESNERYTNQNEVARQLKFNQMFDCIKGSAVYDYTTLVKQNKPITKAGMKIFKNTWDTKVFGLPRGENNIGSTKISETSLIKSSNGEVRVSFEKLENVKGYALYKIAKGEELSFDVKNRVDILYDSYDEGGKTTFKLQDYDENFDYYLRAVSVTNHLSTEATKISTNVVENSAPNNVEVNFNDDQDALLYSVVKGFVPYSSDVEGDELTYVVKISVTGIDGRYYDVDTVSYTDKGIEVTWESYLEGEDCVLKVVISDGDKEITCYSNSIKILEELVDEPDEPVEPEKPTEPDSPVEPTPSTEENSGCKKEVLIKVIISIISLTTGIVLIRKRK